MSRVILGQDSSSRSFTLFITGVERLAAEIERMEGGA